MVVLFVLPPPVPVMVIVRVPVVARELAVNLRVDVPVPGAEIEVGLKLAVTPLGRPLADKEIDELKPFTPAVLTLVVFEPLLVTMTVVGDALMVKLALGAEVTIRVRVVEFTRLPLVPVTVIVYVPVAMLDPTVKVRAEVPEPVIAVGLKAAVTLDGRLDADNKIEPLKPFTAVVVTAD
jgi:hypothetical protein